MLEDPPNLLDLRGLLRRQSVGELERTPHRTRPGLGNPQEAARRGRRESDDVGGEHGLDQRVPLVLRGGEPPQRQDEGPRGGLLRERHARLGSRSRDPRIVQRAEQPPHMRTLAPNDDRQVGPVDALLHVETPQLPGHRRVLLGGVGRTPRVHRDLGLGSVGGPEIDVSRALEGLREAQRRDRGRSLEGEHVSLGVGGDDEVGRPDRLDQCLLRERGVLVVVHEQVIEQGCVRRRGGGLGSSDQSREIDDPVGIQHVEVLAVEAHELAPAREPTRLGLGLDRLRRQSGFLGAKQELTDLVGEASEGQQVTVGGPLGCGLTLQEILDECELVGGRQDLRRLRVAEGAEALAEDEVGEPVEGHDLEARQRPGESGDERVPGQLSGAAGTHDQGDPLRVLALHEPPESFTEHGRFPGAGATGDEQGPPPMGEDGLLLGVRGEGGAHEADATRPDRHPCWGGPVEEARRRRLRVAAPDGRTNDPRPGS